MSTNARNNFSKAALLLFAVPTAEHQSEDNMASTAPNKSSNSKTTAKPSRASNRSSADTRRASNGAQQRRNARRSNAPYWTTTVASLVGVGVALGFGLFATRRRWMPYAEEWNEYLHERWDHYAHADHANDDHSDFNAEDSANDDVDWPRGQEAASASFSGDRPHSNA